MLCSHSKRFIYLKTIKTAGTSVEVFLERFCCPPEGYVEQHSRDEHVSEYGVIGYRGSNRVGATFYSHMAAEQVRKLLGDKVWTDYFKFCVIRNPFDKVVSRFWMAVGDAERSTLSTAPFEAVKQAFAAFCVDGKRMPMDRGIYMIGGEPVVDRFVRFEHLREDLTEVCHRLDIDPATLTLGAYKSGLRARQEPFAAYYDTATADTVRAIYRWEIERFGYTLE